MFTVEVIKSLFSNNFMFLLNCLCKNYKLFLKKKFPLSHILKISFSVVFQLDLRGAVIICDIAEAENHLAEGGVKRKWKRPEKKEPEKRIFIGSCI